MVIWVKIFTTEKTIEIHLVRLTEVCGKVLSEKYANKSYCPMLLMQTTKAAVCLQTKAIFFLPLWVLIGVLAKFHE